MSVRRLVGGEGRLAVAEATSVNACDGRGLLGARVSLFHKD
jgi:hypothetical protein